MSLFRIPVFNRQKGAEAALRSVLAQGPTWQEIVVVDDSSSPAFRFPLDMAADTRLRLVRHEKNQGEASARNTGIREAKGDWIAFLDSDDIGTKGKLAAQIDTIQALGITPEEKVIVVCSFILFSSLSQKSGAFFDACRFQ